MPKRPRRPEFPTKEQVLDYIREGGEHVSRRDIARAFNIRGPDRTRLNAMLREFEDGGVLQRGRGRRYAGHEALPQVMMLEVSGLDPDGDLLAVPVDWPEDVPTPTIFVIVARGESAPGISDRILARLSRTAEDTYDARIMRRLGRKLHSVLGVYSRERNGGLIETTDRRSRADFFVMRGQDGGAKDGDFVRAEIQPGRRYGMPQAKVVDVLGNIDDPGSASLIAIHGYGIPTEFTPEAMEEADSGEPPDLKGRADLRDIPLVTIDDEDARDFDDAVWAEPDATSKDGKGWHIVVAIADVAWYVRSGGALDTAAKERGNSVYFPDRVVPMLPERLSNGLCSLRPDEDRPCLAVHMWIDAKGRKRRHRFERAIMRSAARMTYRSIQAAHDGKPNRDIRPLMDSVVGPLYGAYAALNAAREDRGVLDLDLPEWRVTMDDAGRITDFVRRERLDSHRLIEEFMIAANVAAAETLERRDRPCMYRIHDQPPPAKLDGLRDYLDTLGYRLARGQVMTSRHFNHLLERVRGTPDAEAVSEAVLRSQSQAVYAPENIGHFGLALRRYAHFTSPIRRYADLLVHRALIDALDAGDDGLDPATVEDFEGIAEHISMTERRAASAERETLDRLAAAYLVERTGANFKARISGITRAGLFVTLLDIGADGLVPMSRLGDERFRVEDGGIARGLSTGSTYHVGDPVTVRLEEADAIAGRLAFSLAEGSGPRPGRRPARGKKAGGPPKKPRRAGRGGRRR